MIHGLDTGFLVAAEVTEHGEHTGARATLVRLLAGGDRIALAPQVLAEFIHIVTDPRRFIQPLDMTTARQLAQIPPDLVVKFQLADIAGLILW